VNNPNRRHRIRRNTRVSSPINGNHLIDINLFGLQIFKEDRCSFLVLFLAIPFHLMDNLCLLSTSFTCISTRAPSDLKILKLAKSVRGVLSVFSLGTLHSKRRRLLWGGLKVNNSFRNNFIPAHRRPLLSTTRGQE